MWQTCTAGGVAVTFRPLWKRVNLRIQSKPMRYSNLSIKFLPSFRQYIITPSETR